MKTLTSSVGTRSSQTKRLVALPVFNFTFTEREDTIEMQKWGWTPFAFLHFAVMAEHRSRGFGLNGEGVKLSKKICYQSFYPDTEEPFHWVIETKDHTFDGNGVMPPRPYSNRIRECPFEFFKGRDKSGQRTSEELYVPNGWAKEVWAHARWGVIAIGASFGACDPYIGRKADGSGFPVTEEMLLKFGRRTQYR